jgi:hypothetical protein
LKANNKTRSLCGMTVVCLALSACATGKFLETSTPVLDKNFGQSLKTAKEAQKIPKDPNKPDVNTTPSSKELALPYDNYVKGKDVTTPALAAPISSKGTN